MQIALTAALLLCLARSGHATPSNRDGKFVVVVNPKVCDGNGRSGVCLPYFYCGKYEGTVEGKCTLGLGECCVYQKSCGRSSFAVTTHFLSTDAQATEKGECAVALTKANDVCQLRLDLKTAELAPPDAEGVCQDQFLQVEGVSGVSPKICGTNSGQEIYLDVRADDGPFEVKVTNNVDSPDSEWDIEVEQIGCTSPDLAPAGCLQYIKGKTGEIQSFNYEDKPTDAKQPNGNTGTRHLQEDYSICVRQEPGYCSIKWAAAAGETHAFTLTGDLVGIPGILPPIFGSAINNLCPFTDHLVIAGGTAVAGGAETPASIFCGSEFPEEVVSDSFRVDVVTNDREGDDGDFDNRGFHLEYEQVKC
ncbi:uncharacterized protein LOC125045134 [Penaeus chinensis]|uniref:uncharacterized protein LOC125045134 n=1 Tax=Penaeus chinensis TaxID=139456 RepID=UPI001FB80AF3|nr:uncharacterized protein LOC125045134 [Penaeus chinensis]